MEIAAYTFFFIIGAVSAWLFLRSKTSILSGRLLTSESDRGALSAKLEVLQARVEELLIEHSIESERRNAAQEKLKLLDEAQLKLSDAFKALSAEALKSNNQSFLELANATLEKFAEGAKGDLEKRQQAINNIVKPISESLSRFDLNIRELEKNRLGAYESLTEQVRSLLDTGNYLRTETSNLVKALRSPKSRGIWGEMQLKRTVELAGMLNHCDFFEQKSTNTDEGRLQPDMLIKLPSNKNIVIDAKTPMAAYLDAIEATDDSVREKKLLKHAEHIGERIKELSRKKYWEQFQPTPEFVVLFLPGEAFLAAALDKMPGLIEAGVDQRVIIATPTTLIALLRAVAYGWKEESLTENAKKISALGQELHKRIAKISEYMISLGKSLGKSVDTYNETIRSLETRVMVSARRFKELEASYDSVEIEQLKPLDSTPGRLSAIKTADEENEKEE